MARDILTDDSNALQIESGDFVVGESDSQHVRHIIEAMPGEWRETPLLGVGVRRYLNGPQNIQSLEAEIRRHLITDDFRLQDLTIKPTQDREGIDINCNAVRND